MLRTRRHPQKPTLGLGGKTVIVDTIDFIQNTVEKNEKIQVFQRRLSKKKLYYRILLLENIHYNQ